MQETLRSYSWQTGASARPSVRIAAEVRGLYPGRVMRLVADHWILDYEFLSHGRCGVAGAEPLVWRPREARSVHLYPPLTEFFEDTSAETGRRWSAWVFFDGGEEVDLRSLLEPRNGYARFRDPSGEFGQMLLKMVAVGLQHGEAGFCKAQALLYSTIDLLRRAQGGGDAPEIPFAEQLPSQERLSDQVERWLREHLSKRITLEMLADEFGISASRLSHQFRHESGTSPIAALIHLRVQQSIVLLQRGLPLKAIASQVGFGDAFHLSRTFRQVTGQSPRAFLQGLHGNSDP